MAEHSLGLPARARLLSSPEFRAVLAARCRSVDPLFTVYAIPNGLTHGRLGITVSRKVSVLAVRRNRVKRLIRETFRQNPESVRGMDLAVLAQRATTSTTNKDIIASLENHWIRARARCVKS